MEPGSSESQSVIFICRQKQYCPQAFHVNEPFDFISLFCCRGVPLCLTTLTVSIVSLHLFFVSKSTRKVGCSQCEHFSFSLIGAIVFLFLGGGDQRGLEVVYTHTHTHSLSLCMHQATHKIIVRLTAGTLLKCGISLRAPYDQSHFLLL